MRDFYWNVVLFALLVHLQQQKFVFKLLNEVCSDFTDMDCILLSVK